jgi:hypothetical protein
MLSYNRSNHERAREMLKIFADLQSTEDDNLIVVSLDDLLRPAALPDNLVGESVIIQDGEGHSCRGYVEHVDTDGRILDVRLDLSTWRSEDEVTITAVTPQSVLVRALAL